MFKFLFSDSNERVVKKLHSTVEQINNLEKQFDNLSLEEIKIKTEEFKDRFKKGVSLDELLPEAFALVREAAKHTLKQRHFDVQLLGGIVLHQGDIVEMRTGEGKTLVATLPAYLNSLTGKGVHIITVNDYLARRDAVWMGQIYNALGLKVACINHEVSFEYDSTHVEKPEEKDKERDVLGGFKVVYEFLRPISRKEAYEADIVYGTNSEFGFDYLRDNLNYDLKALVQRQHQYAIVDEIDSILIDEARTPLIISMPDEEAAGLYQKFARVIPSLKENTHYQVDEKRKAATLTDEGITEAENRLGLKNIYESGNISYAHHLEQALRAQVLFKKDRDYVVKNNSVIIVDEFTGRLLPGRRFSEGLHQALEAKEGVEIQKESKTLATITFQNYFRMYEKLAGMTGTALTSAQEFHKVYTLEVVVIPTNKPAIRDDLPDVIYKNEQAKWRAVIEEIKKRHQIGQPVLCGTTSIDKNEKLGAMLKVAGVPHILLNAKNNEEDAQIIAQAGRLGAVTVATNIAGRGVDIVLGGNPFDEGEAKKVKDLGGLHVIGTERHEARRIDNQLRGRAGRQGDHGSTQFFVSLDDDVIRVFGGEKIKGLMETLGLPEDMPITNKLITKAIESAQSKIEAHNFDLRRYVLEFDDVMNKQRRYLYKTRKEILEAADKEPQKLKEKVQEYIKERIKKLVASPVIYDSEGKLNNKQLSEVLINWTGDYSWQKRFGEFKEKEDLSLGEFIIGELLKIYEQKETELKPETLRQIEKAVLLQVIDTLWLEHIANMEHLRNSVGLRAYGQRDPLVEYKKEGLHLFNQLKEAIPALLVANIFKIQARPQIKEQQYVVSDAKKPKVIPRSATGGKIGRNDPCWCGARKPDGTYIKYKHCHGR